MVAMLFAMVVAMAAATVPAPAATSGTAVGATIPSATSLSTTLCPTMTAAVTSFGSVSGGSSYVTASDCELQFGSSNDTSMLRMYQGDLDGDAMISGPTSATLGYWPLNGTRDDLSVTGNPVSAFPAGPADPGYTAAAPTGRGQALDLDGDDYASIPTNAAYDVPSFTVDMWVLTTSTGREIGGRQDAACGTTGLCQWELYMDGSGRLIANAEVGATQHSATTTTNVADGSWHHIAMTVDDSTKEIKAYVDGVLRATDTTWTTGSIETGAMPIYLGTQAQRVAFINGRIDEVRFQSGARTAAEINGYYAGRIRDYADTVNDWDTTAATTSMFGACLREVLDGAITDGTTWTPNATCPTTDGAYWKPIAATSALAGAKIASGPSTDQDNKARIRFGLRIPTTQALGVYTAPINFEVLAPTA